MSFWWLSHPLLPDTERETPFQMELSAGNVNFLYKSVTSTLFPELLLCLLFLSRILIPKRYIWGLHIWFPFTTPKYASLTYGLFWADYFETLQTKQLWKQSINYQIFLHDTVTLERGPAPGRQLLLEITFSPFYKLCLGCINSSHLPVKFIPPLGSPRPVPALSS